MGSFFVSAKFEVFDLVSEGGLDFGIFGRFEALYEPQIGRNGPKWGKKGGEGWRPKMTRSTCTLFCRFWDRSSRPQKRPTVLPFGGHGSQKGFKKGRFLAKSMVKIGLYQTGKEF